MELKGLISPAHRQAALREANARLQQRRELRDCPVGAPTAGSPSASRIKELRSEYAAAMLLASVPTLALARAAGFNSATAALREPPDSVVALAISSVATWQWGHIDGVRRSWLALLRWLRTAHPAQYNALDGSLEAFYTRRFLDSVVNANAPLAASTETSQTPFLHDGQSVAPSIKIALTWLEGNLGLQLGMKSLPLEVIPRKAPRPSRPAKPLPLSVCCSLEKAAASRQFSLPVRVVCAIIMLMTMGVSRFTQLQDCRWVSVTVVRGVRIIKGVNRAEKCRGQSKVARFFWFLVDGFTRHNWLSALVEARALFPDATFTLPDWDGGDVFKATRLLNRPCNPGKFLTALRAVLTRIGEVSCANLFGVASCKKVFSTIARFRFVPGPWRNELGRWAGSLSRGNEFAVPTALLTLWGQRQSIMPDMYATEGVELSICDNLVDQLLATRAHITARGGVDQLPALGGWEGILRLDGGVPLLEDSPATHAQLLELLGPDQNDGEEEEE